MNIAVIIALIALIGSLFSAALTVFGAPIIQQRYEARKALEKYREPLLDASYELQARLRNILSCGFVERFVTKNEQDRCDSAINSTLYVFAQFFGWREIIRQEIRYLQFPKDKKTKEILALLRKIGDTFLVDTYGPQFMIWRVEQRGIGERMIESRDGNITCVGYASFVERGPETVEWLNPIKNDLRNINDGGRERLTELQHLLLRLVRELDEEKKRYPEPPALEEA